MSPVHVAELKLVASVLRLLLPQNQEPSESLALRVFGVWGLIYLSFSTLAQAKTTKQFWGLGFEGYGFRQSGMRQTGRGQERRDAPFDDIRVTYTSGYFTVVVQDYS